MAREKSEGFTTDDLLLSGQMMELTKKKCKNIIADVSGVVATFPDIADSIGIRADYRCLKKFS